MAEASFSAPCYSCRCRVSGAALEQVTSDWPSRVVTGAAPGDALSPAWHINLCPICAAGLRLLETLHGNPLTEDRYGRVLGALQQAQSVVTEGLVARARLGEAASQAAAASARDGVPPPPPPPRRELAGNGDRDRAEPRPPEGWSPRSSGAPTSDDSWDGVPPSAPPVGFPDGDPWERGDDPDDPRGAW